MTRYNAASALDSVCLQISVRLAEAQPAALMATQWTHLYQCVDPRTRRC